MKPKCNRLCNPIAVKYFQTIRISPQTLGEEQKMKKWLSMLMALVMVLSMASVALAEEATPAETPVKTEEPAKAEEPVKTEELSLIHI